MSTRTRPYREGEPIRRLKPANEPADRPSEPTPRDDVAEAVYRGTTKALRIIHVQIALFWVLVLAGIVLYLTGQ